jgi:hypothetical protein
VRKGHKASACGWSEMLSTSNSAASLHSPTQPILRHDRGWWMKRFKENGLEEAGEFITPFRDAMRRAPHKRKRNGGVFLLQRLTEQPIHGLTNERNKDTIKQDRYMGSLKARGRWCTAMNKSRLVTLVVSGGR